MFLLFQVSGEQLFADVAKDILLYVSRDLSDKVNHPLPYEDLCVCVCMRACFCDTGFMGTRCPPWGTKVMANIAKQGFFFSIKQI